MNFDCDAFISYAHLDNVALKEGSNGWIANLHRALEIRVAQLLGKKPHIWRDPKLKGNDVFAETLIRRLGQVAVLVSVVSPSYIKSEWTAKELAEFRKAAEEQGGVRFRNRARIFKVLKTQVPREQQDPELKALLGYEFFKVDPQTGRVRELDEIFGPEAQKDFWIKLDDLAYDICSLLQALEEPLNADALTVKPAKGKIFLAETTSDLRDQRDIVKRDLVQHGYIVFPDRPLVPIASELEAAVRSDLAECCMSIHLVGRSYSLVPEGGMMSVSQLQNELAIERSERGSFSRLVWIPQGLQVEDERQRKIIDEFRLDPRMQKGADLLETSLEDLKTVIQDRLKGTLATEGNPVVSAATEGNIAHVYLVYDQRDGQAIEAWADFLFEQNFEVVYPAFEGDEAEVRESHEENLRTCDGVLILYGAGNECWLRRKLRDIQKSPGYGRTKSMPVIAVSMMPPKTPEKVRFRTHGAIMISQWDGFSSDPLQPFISRLKG